MEITQEEYDQLIAKAKEDEVFQQQLLDKPIETIESFTGKKIDLDEIELSEEDLEQITGGSGLIDYFINLFTGTDRTKDSLSGETPGN